MICGKSELCIFNHASPQAVIDNYSFETIYPINSISNSSTAVEFNIHGSETYYLDLNDTLLSCKLQVTKADDTNLAANQTEIIPMNYLFYGLFKDVVLSLNGTQIEGGNNTYAQKALIDAMINFSGDTKKTYLRSVGYFQTDAGRIGLIGQSNKFDLCGPLNLDFFEQPKYLIPGVSVYIKLKRNENNFLLKGDGKVKILEMRLHVRRVKVAPSVLLGHQVGLSKQHAIYPIRKTRLLTYSLAKGSLNFYKDQIFGDLLLPKFVLITFQRTSTLNGDVATQSSVFEHANVKSVTLSRNTDYNETYEVDFQKNEHCVAYVQSIIRNFGLLNLNINNGITQDEFEKVSPFFTFVLAADFDINQPQLNKSGNLKLDIKFSKGLENPISVLVYGVFDSEIQISKSKTVEFY